MLPRKIFVVVLVLLVVRLVVDAIIARTVLRFGPALKSKRSCTVRGTATEAPTWTTGSERAYAVKMKKLS